MISYHIHLKYGHKAEIVHNKRQNTWYFKITYKDSGEILACKCGFLSRESADKAAREYDLEME